jgi:hypothetical protein
MDKKEIITSASLQNYFFENLNELNRKSLLPVPNELIFYSSQLMEKFSLSHELFDQTTGRPKDKILGLMYLESQTHSFDEQIKIYKEVGDVSLFLCGYFGKSLSKKIHDTEYYMVLGKNAYLNLDKHVPKYLDIPAFYKTVASCYENLIVLISKVASYDKSDPYKHLLFDINQSDQENKIQGILFETTKKVS